MIMEFNITAGIFHPFATSVILDKTSKLALRKREMFYLTTHSTHFIYGYI